MDSDENRHILEWAYSLPKDNTLRQQADLVLSNPQILISDVQPIVRAFEKRSVVRWNERTVAAWLIKNTILRDGQSTAISVELSGLLGKGIRASRPGLYLLYSTSDYALICCLIVAGVTRLDLFELVLFLLALSGAVQLFWFRWADRCKLLDTIEALGDLGQPEAIASIANAMRYRRLCNAAERALAKLTANLRPEHYGTLPGETVPALCTALKNADHPTTLVILKALLIIGDGRAIRAVEKLAAKPPLCDLGEVAAHLLPILRKREQESKSSSQLLRASTASEDGEQELLRGVTAEPEGDPTLLVRASAGTAEEAT